MKKKVIYWGGLIILFAVGALVSFHQLLPIYGTVPFLMGLLFIWIGLMALLKVNQYWTREDTRLCEVLSSVVYMGFGAAYVLLSMSPRANEGLPVLIVSIPFILAMMAIVAWSQWAGKTDS